MSETQPQPPVDNKPPMWANPNSIATIISAASGLLGKTLSASPLGIAFSAVVGLVGFFAIRAMIKRFNAYVDKRDDAKAGEFAGQGSVDLRNQAHQIKNELDQLQKMAPPKKEETK